MTEITTATLMWDKNRVSKAKKNHGSYMVEKPDF